MEEAVVPAGELGPRPVQGVHHRWVVAQQRAHRRAGDAAVVVHDVEVVVDGEVGRDRVVGVEPRVPEEGRVGRVDQWRHELRLGARPTAGEEGDVVTPLGETVGEEGDHQLDPAVAGGGNGEPGRRDLGDLHLGRAYERRSPRTCAVAFRTHVAAVDHDGERVAPRRWWRRHPRRGSGLLDLVAVGRHGTGPAARPLLPRHPLPLRAAAAGERALARAARRDHARPVQRRVRAARPPRASGLPTPRSWCSATGTSGAACAKT